MKQYISLVKNFIILLPLLLGLTLNAQEKTNDLPDISPDRLARREASIAFLKTKGVPTMAGLPTIAGESQTQLRSKKEIAQRALALCYLGVKSEGVAEKKLIEFENRYGVSAYFTPQEKQFVEATEPSKQQMIDANWRYECLHVLLWALSYQDSLYFPGQLCDVAEDVGIIAQRSKKAFFKEAQLRSKKEILDQADLIYRIHWACVEARLNGQEPPPGVDPEVVYEWHYALNWLIRYMDQEWDEVTTDT